MSLTEIIQNADSVLRKVYDLDKRLNEERESIADRSESIKSDDLPKWREMCDRYMPQMELLRKMVVSSLTSILQVPRGIELDQVEARERWTSLNHPARIELMFSLDDAVADKLSFGQVYARAYQLKSDVPTLDYSAHVIYDRRQFLTDTHFDPRAFRNIKMSKSGTTFTNEPFLVRNELTGDLEVEYDASKQEIRVSAGYRREVWGPILRDVAEQFEGKIEVSLYGSDYAKMMKGKSFFDRAKTHLTLLSILQREKSNRKSRQLTKALMAGMGFPLNKQESWTRYEGTISVNELAELEQFLGSDIHNHVSSVKIHADVLEDHSKVKDTLQRLGSYVSKVDVPGTSPGEFRISRERARDFLQHDLDKMYKFAEEVPLSSYFCRQRFANSVISGTEYERLHLPLLRKLGRLSSLNIESLFPQHSFIPSSRKEKTIKPDEYSPNSVDEVLRELQRIHIPASVQQEVMGKLQERKSEYKECGYLTIHELYNLQLKVISQLQRENPEELLERYLGLYKDHSASPLSITGSVGKVSYGKESISFPHPFIMNFDGRTDGFTFTDGAEDNLGENYLGFLSGDGKLTLRLKIIPENPCLLPLQQYALELLGVQVANGKVGNYTEIK